MSPRTGRPTDDPKRHESKIRFSDADIGKLDYCSRVLGIAKAEVIRQGIDRMYEEAQRKSSTDAPK